MSMRSAIIVGCAPSLDVSLIPEYHEISDCVVALNRAFKAWSNYPHLEPDMYYVMDGPNAYKDCIKSLVEEANKSVMIVPCPSKPDKVPYIRRWQNHGVEIIYELDIDQDNTMDKNPFDSDKVCKPMKTLLIAWQHLIHCGFNRIGIAGVDLACDPKNRYFCDWEPLTPNQHKTQARSYGIQAECLRNWLPHAEALGIETINLSGPDSRLATLMPSASLGQFCRERAKRKPQ